MNKLLSAFAIAILSLGLAAAPAGAEGYTKQKVVYHINGDDPKQQTAALRNIQNHINAVGADKLDLKVVMHGNGVSLLLLPEALARVPKMKQANATPEMTARIDGLRQQGVQFQVCSNTLTGRNIDLANDLYYAEAGDVVASGVAQLAHLQAQGYTYIKP